MRAARPWVAVGILGLALAWALAGPSPAGMWAAARGVPPTTWLLAAFGWLLSYALRAQRLHDEWALRTGMGWSQALALTLLHSAAINLIPMRAGEAAFPWLMHRRWQVALPDSMVSLVWLRLQDALVLACLAGAALMPAGDLGVRLLAALSVLTLLALGLPRLARAWSRRGRRTARLLQPLAAAAPRSWVWSTANWLVKTLASAHLAAGLLSLDGPPADAWRCWPASLAAEVGGALPLHMPSGFGAWEGGFWLGLSATDATTWSASQVFGAALTVHLSLVLLGTATALLTQLPALRSRKLA